MSISETGHAINIANFKLLIDKNTGFGVRYNPTNTRLTIVNLTTQWTTADALQTAINTAITAAKDPINERQIIFEPVNTTTSQALDHLNSLDVSKQIKKDAKGFADKVRGVHPKNTPAPPAVGPTPADFTSQSQQSYVNRADNFQKFVLLLGTVAAYAPNEAEIKVATLTNLYNKMKGANDISGAIISTIETARLDRDHAIYDETLGIVDTALTSKKYVKSVYKARSAEYRLVSGIKFTRKKP